MEEKTMRKVVVVALGLLLALSAGLALAQRGQPPARRVPTPAFQALLYPRHEEGGAGQSGAGYGHACYATADDLETVVAFYERATGEKLTPDEPGQCEARPGWFFCDDSVGPPRRGASERPRRPVAVRLLVKHAEAYDLTLVISRAAGEGHTHIVLDYFDKASPQ
jgi:hypothetical protein